MIIQYPRCPHPHTTIVFFGDCDIGGGTGVIENGPFLHQYDGLWHDYPELYDPPKIDKTNQEFLMLTELVPQRLINNMAPVNNQAEAEAAACPAAVELRFSDLRSLDTVIRWLLELRDEFASRLSKPEDAK